MAATIKDVINTNTAVAAPRAFSAFAVNPAAGDAIVVMVATFNASAVPTAPTDSKGNVYTQIGALSGGSSTKISMWLAKNVAAGATTVSMNGSWTSVAGVAWLLTGMSNDPYNNDVAVTFGTTTGANTVTFGPTTSSSFFPNSLFLTASTVAGTNDLGTPTGYNTTGVNGFTAGMATAAKKLDWTATEDCQTAYKISSALESSSFPTSPGNQQWATVVASFSPPRIATPSSVAPAEGATIGGTAVTITGTGFGSWVTGVTFGGVAATSVVVVNSTTITCVSPAGAAGNAVIAVVSAEGSGSLLSSQWLYSVMPVPTSVTPQFAILPATGRATIRGTGFLNGCTVTFGGVPATGVTFVSSTEISCDIPTGVPAGNAVITVTNP